MAEGRMLKRVISDSKRVAQLQNDTHRMLYTWLLAHLDVEGRFSAEPCIVRGHVVPRLKHVTDEVIESALEDMARVDLIIIYEVDGDRFLQYRIFHKHNKVRRDKEGISHIPGPPVDNNGDTPVPGPVPPPVPGPDESKVSKVKLSKGKVSKDGPFETEEAEPFQLPDKDEINESAPSKIIEDINEVCRQLVSSAIYPEAVNYVMAKRNERVNNRALLHALCRLSVKGKVEHPKSFLDKIISIENGNYNELEHRKSS
jgi:hypothetical protein